MPSVSFDILADYKSPIHANVIRETHDENAGNGSHAISLPGTQRVHGLRCFVSSWNYSKGGTISKLHQTFDSLYNLDIPNESVKVP